MASLESLNDDCIRIILKYCHLEDHISLVTAFEQFKPIIQDTWKIFWKKLRLQTTLRGIELFYPDDRVWRKINNESLKILLDLIQSFVKEIEIGMSNNDIWDIFNESQFANATELRLYNTSAVPLVKSCFPDLRSLVLLGSSMVKYNPEWNGLENVDVRDSYVGISEIMEFISQLKLKKLTINRFKQPIPDQYRNCEFLNELEEISGPAIGVKELLNTFSVSQKLRKVSTSYYTGLESHISKLSKILETRAIEVFTICETHSSIKNLEYQLQQLPNLKRLTLECNDIEAINMFSRSCKLHLLKSLVLFDIKVDAEVLTNILISVRQLELLELGHCIMDGTRLMHLDVARIAQERSKPITINLDHLNRNKFEILLSAPTDLIKITKNPIVRQYYNFQYILEQQ